MTRTDSTRAYGRAYDRRRRRAIAAGTWQPPVPITDLQPHIAALKGRGMSINAIAEAANVSSRVVWPIAAGKQQFAHGPTAAAILAVAVPEQPLAPTGMVHAHGVARRLQALVASGYTLRGIARMLGHVSAQQVWDWAHHTQETVTEGTARTVGDLYESLSATPGGQRRALNYAQRRGWLPPLAWGDDIDDPDAVPCVGAATDDIVDEVAVREVLAGRVRFADLREQEKLALFRDHLGDWTYNRIMDRLHVSGATVQKWRTKVMYGEQVAA